MPFNHFNLNLKKLILKFNLFNSKFNKPLKKKYKVMILQKLRKF